MSATGTQPDLFTLINPFEMGLLAIARRQFLIEAFTGDLDRVTRGKPFRFRNGPVWLLLLDTRDMLVVHLASWAEGVTCKGGLIGRLEAGHIRDLPRKLPVAGVSASDAPDWIRDADRHRREREHAESFNRLFPNAGSHPKRADFATLRQAFRAHVKPLADDRNWNRAHAFEKVSGTAKMLDVAELRSYVSYAERFMNDLRMVGLFNSFGYNEMNVPSGTDVAPDLVDAMLIGDPERLLKARGTSSRDELYDRLHRAHEARPPKSDDYFNDLWMPLPLPVSSAGEG